MRQCWQRWEHLAEPELLQSTAVAEPELLGPGILLAERTAAERASTLGLAEGPAGSMAVGHTNLDTNLELGVQAAVDSSLAVVGMLVLPDSAEPGGLAMADTVEWAESTGSCCH